MARFYRLKLGSIYFTSNGLASGVPCKIELSGVDALLGDVVVTSVDVQNDFSVKLQTGLAQKKGVELACSLLGSLKSSTYNALNDLIENSLANGSSLTLVATGEPLNFTAQVVAFTPTSKSFSDDRIKGASFRFITV